MNRSSDQGRLLVGNAEFFLFGAVGTFLLPFYYLSFRVNHRVAYPDPLVATCLFLTIGAVVCTARWNVLSVTRKTLTIILIALLLALDWMCAIVFVQAHTTISIVIGIVLAGGASLLSRFMQKRAVFGLAVWASAIAWTRLTWGLLTYGHL